MKRLLGNAKIREKSPIIMRGERKSSLTKSKFPKKISFLDVEEGKADQDDLADKDELKLKNRMGETLDTKSVESGMAESGK